MEKKNAIQTIRSFFRSIRSFFVEFGRKIILEKHWIIEFLFIFVFGVVSFIIVSQFLVFAFQDSDVASEQEDVRLLLPVVERVTQWTDGRQISYIQSIDVSGDIFVTTRK